MKAENNRFPYVTHTPRTSAPSAAPDSGDQREWIDSTEALPLRKLIASDDTEQTFWPIYVIPHGGTVPSGLAGKTIILEEDA